MLCPSCGGRNDPGDQFCRTCGRTLADGPIPFTEPEPALAPEAVQMEPEASPVLTLEPPVPEEPPAPAFSEEVPPSELPSAEEPPVPEEPAEQDLPPIPPPPNMDGTDWPDEEYGEPLPASRRPRWLRSVLIPLLLSLALFFALTAAGLSTALALGGGGEALRAAAPGLSLALLSPLRLLAGLGTAAAAAGLWLLGAGLALSLFRLASRPLAAWRWLGPSAALSGLLLLLIGLRAQAFAALLPGRWSPLLAVLEGDASLSWRVFVAGVALLAAGLVTLLTACAVRREPCQRRRASLGALTLCALLLFSSASGALSGAYTATAASLTRSLLLTPAEDPALTAARDAARAGDHARVVELLSPLPDSGGAEAPLLLASSHLALSDPDAALAVLRPALEDHPGDAALRAAMGDTLTALGNRAAVAAASDRARIERAVSYYREAQRYAPDNTTLSLAILALNEMAAQDPPSGNALGE